MRAMTLLLLLSSLLAPQQSWAGDQAAPAPEPAVTAQATEDIPEWRARWELAKLLSHEKRYGEALAEYRRVLAQKPDLQQAKVEMAQVLYWDGRSAEALRMMESLPQDSLEPKVRLALADLLMAQKRYGEAEPLLRRYLEQFPDDHAARLKLADMLSWEKRYEASLAEFRRILQALPQDAQVRRKFAMVLIWAGQRQAAIAELKKTLPKGGGPGKR